MHILENPKSTNFIFPGLIYLCTIFILWRCKRADNSWCVINVNCDVNKRSFHWIYEFPSAICCPCITRLNFIIKMEYFIALYYVKVVEGTKEIEFWWIVGADIGAIFTWLCPYNIKFSCWVWGPLYSLPFLLLFLIWYSCSKSEILIPVYPCLDKFCFW